MKCEVVGTSDTKISELKLSLLLAAAAIVGGVVTTVANSFFVDAATEKRTDVQLVELAINILNNEIPEESAAPYRVLRGWAVDTINLASEIKFDDTARQLLIDGEVVLPAILSGRKDSAGAMEAYPGGREQNSYRYYEEMSKALRELNDQLQSDRETSP